MAMATEIDVQGSKMDTGYLESVSRRNWTTWVFSGLAAAALNLVLFLWMPYLMDPAPPQAAIETVVPQVHVIRLKKRETPVKRKPIRPPEPREIETVTRPTAPAKSRPVKIRHKMTLPFEINPRLPSGPTTLDLPPMESAPMVDIGGLPEIFSVGELDGSLTVLTRVPPVYPFRAKRRGIEGWVRVRFLVDEAGAVGRVTVLEAEPSGVFEKSVERSVSRWRFAPGTVGGMPVKTMVETTVRFELEG